ncbi:MAG TPA: hypothetical protein VN451_06330 [Chitinophagaceae bacterium]|nr:hypothetical protein [Chitinophagaceae bacterium]
MFAGIQNDTWGKSTTHKIVVPFYLYAALSFLACAIMLLFSAGAFKQHYFNPQLLAITHIMALGWGTMIILGASHQLVPVFTGKSLFSKRLAIFTFILAAAGIPLLIYGFYVFNMGWPAKWGGRFILLATICYVINLTATISKSRTKNIHTLFIISASAWLLFTVSFGLVLVYNFNYPFLEKESLVYLPLHAHAGIAGWFLLLVVGVGSRLIPMFLISKYSNTKLLWMIFIFINGGLISFMTLFLFFPGMNSFLISILLVMAGLLLFGYYCRQAWRHRLRKKLDEQMKISLLSVLMMLLPFFILLIMTGWLLTEEQNTRLVTTYGFVIFFGWITAIILGMTFKTLPFIVWNKVYHDKAGLGKTPSPKDLFSGKAFTVTGFSYLTGFILFIPGIYMAQTVMLNTATVLLLIAALFYNFNVLKIVLHKTKGS